MIVSCKGKLVNIFTYGTSACILPKEVGVRQPLPRNVLPGVLGRWGSYKGHLEKWWSDGKVRVIPVVLQEFEHCVGLKPRQ